MKTLLILLINLTLVSSLVAEILQPIGTIGRGVLEQVDFLPDGRILAVLSDRIEIQDAETGGAIASFAKRTEGKGMGRFAISPNGAWIAIANSDWDTHSSDIEIWDITAQQQPHHWDTSEQIQTNVRALAFSPIEPLLAIATEAVVHLWNWKTEAYLGKLESDRPADAWTSTHINLSVQFAPDGKRLVVGRSQLAAEVWEVSSRQLVAHLDGGSSSGSKVAYSSSGRWIATTPQKPPTIDLWDARTNAPVRSWSGGFGIVRQLFFNPNDDGQLYVVSEGGFHYCTNGICSGRDDKLRIFEIRNGRLMGELGDDLTRLQHASLSPDSKQVLLSYAEEVGAYALWNVEGNHRIDLRADYLYSSALVREISADNRSLLTVNDYAVKIWDVPSQSLRRVIFPTKSTFEYGAISPDSQKFVIGHGQHYEVRDIHTGEITVEIPYRTGVDNFPVTFSSDGRQIAFYAATATIVHLAQPQALQFLELKPPWRNFSPYPRIIVFSSDDAYLASADWDGSIHLWKRNREGQYAYQYSWRSGLQSIEVAFRPAVDSNAPILIASTFDGTEVWRLDPGVPLEITPMELREIGWAQFSRDGRFIFANRDGQFQVWDWRRQEPVVLPQPIPAHFAVSGDGSVLITREYGTWLLHLWDGNALFASTPVAVELQDKQIITLGQLKRTALLQNYPNPFNPETWIPYQLAEAAHVRIQIYDVSGRSVRELDLGDKPAGSYMDQQRAAYWNGRNDQGEAVSSGMYFYTMESGDHRTTRRMSVVK